MVVAMVDGEKAGSGMVDAMGMFSVDVYGRRERHGDVSSS